MPAWLPLVFLLAKPLNPDAALHKIDVHVAGPLAMVEVWRTVEAKVRSAGDKQSGAFFDLDLPAGAALLDFEVIDRGKPVRLGQKSEVEANAALTAGLKLRRLAAPPAGTDDGTDYRIHLTPLGEAERGVLHYRYAALAGCKDGQLVLRMPQSQEEEPVPAEVTVTFEGTPDANPVLAVALAGKPAELPAKARKRVVQATVPPRPDWDITWSHAKPVVAAAALVPGVRATGARARAVPQYEVAATVCRPASAAAAAKPPERLELLIDRSRSVGPGGLSAERVLARALAEALPPSVLLDAVVFGGTVEAAFPLPRMPTREALDAVTHLADPNHLENGTDVAAALATVRARLGSTPGGAWIALVTDGALPPGQTAEAMQKALGAGAAPKVMVLLVRQHGDEEVPAASIAQYVRFARSFGGLVRVVPPGSPGETARQLVAAMAKGGDWLDVRLEDAKLADVVPPGQGAAVVQTTLARLPADKRLRVSARTIDGDWRAEVKPALVGREWLDPLLDRRTARRAWAGATAGMAVAVLPGPLPGKPADDVLRGRMDPGVLRNALALAFTPRARACYVSRRVAKAGDSFLRGRLKLELNLERGELQDAVVRSSTLGNPTVEDCVRKAAWAVEYPRPEHRDAPTIANVNLVFSPRTGPEAPAAATATDKEIELILGPLTSPNDFRDLLDSPDGGLPAAAATP